MSLASKLNLGVQLVRHLLRPTTWNAVAAKFVCGREKPSVNPGTAKLRARSVFQKFVSNVRRIPSDRETWHVQFSRVLAFVLRY